MASRDDPSLRWDPSVTPTTAKFINQLSVFKYLLSPASEETLDSILTDYFTPTERDLALPATSPAWLVAEQAHYTKRYRRLLATRFAGVDDDAAARLTMLYFGLPSEPLMSGMFRAVDPDVEMLDGADTRVYEVRPPLHFLTAYDNRHYGRDELRGTEAPLSYIPMSKEHAAALKLGRPIDEPEEPRSSLRGGGEPDDDDDLIEDTVYPANPMDETSQLDGSDPPENIMLGFQGSLRFNPNEAAINGALLALLSLVPQDTERMITITHLDMERLAEGDNPEIMSYNDRYPLCKPMLNTIQAHRHHTDDPVQCCAWFVRFQDEDEPIPWQPTPEHKQQMVMLGLADHPDDLRAYLSLPDAVGRPLVQKCGKNAYSTHMRTAMQVLLGRMSAPGDKHRCVRVHDDAPDASAPLSEQMWCYGGLDVPRQVYERLHRSAGRATTWTLQRADLDKKAVVLVIEGFEQVPRAPGDIRRNFDMVVQEKPVPGRPARPGDLFRGAWDKLDGMLDQFLSSEMKKVSVGVSVTPTYDMFEGGPDDASEETHPGSFFEYNHSNGVRDEPVWARDFAIFLEDNFLHKGHLGFNITLTCGGKYSLIPTWAISSKPTPEDLDKAAFPLKTLEIEDLHKTIDALMEQQPHPIFGERIGRQPVLITLEAVPMSRYTTPPTKVIITDETHPDEFRLALSQLMTSRFLVTLTNEKGADFHERVSGAIPWGPRYNDVATFTARREEGHITMPSLSEMEDGGTVPNSPKRYPSASPERSPPSAPTQSGPAAGNPPTTAKAPALFGKTPMGPPPVPVKQPSIFNGGRPTIPITGPYRESFLRTGSPAVPSLTQGVMTPTDQQRARDALHAVRNQNLGRSLTCHYRGCDFVTDAADAEGMQRHLEERHVAAKCPWCDNKLFAHWSQTERDNHIAYMHGDKVRSLAGAAPQQGGAANGANGQTKRKAASDAQKKREEEAKRRKQVYAPQPRATGIPRPPAEADPAEASHKYCDRCGREHALFGDKERKIHDKRCLPRAPHEDDLSWCKDCGAKNWRTRQLTRQQEGDYTPFPHGCNDSPYTDFHAPYCTGCAFPVGDLAKDNAHAEHCRGFSGKLAQFCPHCRAPLGYIRDHAIREKHIVACRGSGGKDRGSGSAGGNPYALYARCMWEDTAARPDMDQFYTGWRADFDPRTWTPRAREWQSHPSANPAETEESSPSADGEPSGAQNTPADAQGRGVSPQPAPASASEGENTATGTQKTKYGPKRGQDDAWKQSASKRPKNTHTQDATPDATPAPNASETKKDKKKGKNKGKNKDWPEPAPAQPDTASGERRSTRSRRTRLPSTAAPEEAPSTKKASSKARQSNKPPSPKEKQSKKPPQPKEKKPEKPPKETQADASDDDEDDPNFKPEAGMFCSQCFRKVPSANSKPKAGDPSFEYQMDAHMNPDLCCRIRRRRGAVGSEPITSGVGLPNQSGWMLEKDLPVGTSSKQLRDEFKKQYPEYAQTAYLGGGTQSTWTHDPNNEKGNAEGIKLSRELPPLPGTENVAEEAEAEAEVGAEGAPPGVKKSIQVVPQGTEDVAEEEAPVEEAGESEPEGEDGDDGQDDDDDPAPRFGGGGNPPDDDEPGDDDAPGPGTGGGNAPGAPDEPEEANDGQPSAGSAQDSPKGGKGKSEKNKSKAALKRGANDGTYRDQREAQSEDEEPTPDEVRADDPQGASPSRKNKPSKVGAGGKTPKQKTTISFAPGHLEALERAAAEEAERKARARKRSVEVDEDEDEEEQPKAKGRKTARASRAAAGRRTKKKQTH